jgi:hypothetical protein
VKRPVFIAAALCACVPGKGPLMDPGQDCLFCHVKGGEASGSPWSAAGTVFQPGDTSQGFEGAQVHITDATGFSFSLRSNLAGNFYTAESLRFPLQACIEANGKTVCQQSPVITGSCNVCHGLSISGATQPPLTAPPP